MNAEWLVVKENYIKNKTKNLRIYVLCLFEGGIMQKK